MNSIKTILNKTLFLSICFIPILSYSQHNTEKELMENNVKEIFITAREYDDDTIAKEVKSRYILDEFGNSLEYIKYAQDGSINKSSKSYYQDNGKTTIDTTFRDTGEIQSVKVYTKDLDKNTITYSQIKPPNDTLITQIRYRNKKDKDSVVISTKGSKTYLSNKWEYNKDGDLEKTTAYRPDGSIWKLEKIKYRNDGKCTLYFDEKGRKKTKICRDNGEKIIFFYEDSVGYLYGIKLTSKNKGKRVAKRDEKGLVKAVQYLDKKGNIDSEIVYQYVF